MPQLSGEVIRQVIGNEKELNMMPKFKRIALAVSVGVFLAATSMAQAAAKPEDPLRLNKSDKFKETAIDENGNKAVLGGSLFVSDPSKPVVFTFIADDDLFHNDKTYYWRDGLDGEWQVLFDEDTFRSYKKGTTFSETLNATSDQVFFAISVNYTTLKKSERGVYLWSTGDGSLNETPSSFGGDKNAAHSYVFYDYHAENVALIGFEDTRRFIADDWDDAIFTVSNVQGIRPVIPTTPIPPSVPEPETYAMLLAGLGLIGAVARRRRM
jgi:hypothetical protein